MKVSIMEARKIKRRPSGGEKRSVSGTVEAVMNQQ